MEIQQLLECSDTPQDKEHTSGTETTSPTIVGIKFLSKKNAVRLKGMWILILQIHRFLQVYILAVFVYGITRH